MRKLLPWGGLLVIALFASAGSVPNSPSAFSSVDTVDVSPNLDTLFGAEHFSLTARLADSAGRELHRHVTWTIRNTTLFKTPKIKGNEGEQIGGYSKGDSGRTYAVATAESKKDSALLIIRDTVCSNTVVGGVNLFPDSMTAHRTDTLSVVALPRNTCGGAYIQNLTWASSDSAKATITRLDSTIARVVVLDSNGTVYLKGITGTKRDSVKLKLKHAP
jgi:uncharacterized protein YjdB